MAKSKNSFRIPGEGRRAYLEFLRNTTSQILILSFALVIGNKLDFTTFDADNTTVTVSFFVLIAATFLAIYANVSLLIESCYSDLPRWGRKILSRNKNRQVSSWSKFVFPWIALFKKRFFVVSELLFVGFFLQLILLIVIFQAISLAVKFDLAL